MTRVPHTAENFRYYYTWDTFEPVAPNAWIGPAPRLDSLDEGLTAARASDAAIIGDAALGLANTVSFGPFTLNPAGEVKLTVQMRVYGADYGGVVVFLSNEGDAADDFAYAEFEVYESQGWVTLVHVFPNDWRLEALAARAAAGQLIAGVYPGFIPDNEDYYHEISAIVLDIGGAYEGVLAIDTHDHPFHVVGTRDPAMPYELVIDTGTQRLVEIVAGEEALATHELVIDETGRAGDPWTHCGLFRPL